eukprot:CAMPEP_0184301428 /NCGR_PEP_ID=MMETSP1049-20130417/11634_1 /TAXON_ID=77928 /ORGANISM="Proteomonas sulcata, Strain CCMP704" /LENGTH=353 /DNA_ID=CAMNT_0026612433 /DNA_START=32 /DNA_END=1094 /DNA_ORIENTATION=+
MTVKQELQSKKAAIHHLSTTLQKSVHVNKEPAYSNWPGARTEEHVHHKEKHTAVVTPGQGLAAKKDSYSNWPGSRTEEHVHHTEKHAAVTSGQGLATRKAEPKVAGPEAKQDSAQASGVMAEKKALKAEAKPVKAAAPLKAQSPAGGVKENVKKAVSTQKVAKPAVNAVTKGAQKMASAAVKGNDEKDPRLEYSHKKDHRLGFSKFNWLFKDTESDMRDEKPHVHSHAKQIALQGGENATDTEEASADDDSGDDKKADDDTNTTSTESTKSKAKSGEKTKDQSVADDIMVSKDREMYFIVTLLVSIVLVTLMGLCCIRYARTILGADSGERPPVGAAGQSKGVRGYGTVGRGP